MAAGAAAVTVAATAYQIYANEQATKEKKKASLMEAQARDIEAAEMLGRFEINKTRLTKDYMKYRGDVGLATAQAGIDMSGSSLLMLEQINKDYQEELYNMQREAQFKSSQMYREGDFSRSNARTISKVGRTQSTGVFMQGAANLANIYSR